MDQKPRSTLSVAIRLLRESAAGEWPRIAVGVFLLLCAAGVALLQPWPLKIVIDSVLGGHPPPQGISAAARVISGLSPSTTDQTSLLVLLCLSVLAIQIMVGLFNVISTYVLVSIGLRMVFTLRCRLFDHLQRLSLAFHDATPVGDSLYRVTWDTYSAQALFNGGLVPAMTATLTLVGITIIMLSIDVEVTIAALAVCIPLIVFVRRLDKPMTERSMRVHERESGVSSRVQETLSGIRAVQAFGRETIEGQRFRTQAGESLSANLRLTLLQTGSQAIVGALLALGTALVVWFGARQAAAGELTSGDVVLLVTYLGMLYKPLETLAYTAASIQGATSGARRVFAVLDAAPDVVDAPSARPLPGRARGHVRFEHVTFGYHPDRPVVHGIDLEIPAGTTTALVGLSGAGKSTLTNLLLRFYDPLSGRVVLDGYDLRSLSLASLRENIAIVPQEPVLFSASVWENVVYGRPDASAAEVEAAVRAAGAASFIAALPDGFETAIGERGVALSGGQRQRLAIARAFLKDVPILVMDEPTSALDSESEAELLASLERLMRDRTTLVIAHRLSTIRNADRIVVLRDGEIVEDGTHNELLARGALYAHLYDLQFGKRAAAAIAGGYR